MHMHTTMKIFQLKKAFYCVPHVMEARGVAKVTRGNIYWGPSAHGLQWPASCTCVCLQAHTNRLPVRRSIEY